MLGLITGLWHSNCVNTNVHYPTGVVFYYVLLQLALWWLLHVSILFWKICFPFHARSFESAGRFKYVHIVCVIVGLLVPWIPVIVVFANGGFTMITFPPLPCTGREAGPTFYGLVLPIILLLQIGITLLIILFWTVHKVCPPKTTVYIITASYIYTCDCESPLLITPYIDDYFILYIRKKGYSG